MERFLHYFDEMPHYLTVHDREHRIVDGNRRFREDFGDRLGEPCYRVLRGLDAPCPDCPTELTFADGRSHQSETWLRRRDGSEVPVLTQSVPLRDPDGATTAVMVLSSDIREVKNLQRRLQRSQERWARLFEEVPCCISVHGPDFRIQHGNRRFRQAFGGEAGDLCFRVYRHRAEPCPACPLLAANAGSELHEHEELLVTRTGVRINALCSVVPIYDPDGVAVAVLEMVADVTQIRELQSQLTSIGLLVGSISHGVKGALTGLDGGVYLVNSGLEKNRPERLREGWDMVQRSIQRVRSIVADILYLAKERDLMLAQVDVASVCDEIRQTLVSRAASFAVELSSEVPADAGTLVADERRLAELLLALLENGLEACRLDPAKPAHRVSLTARRCPPWMVFAVEDNGTGMDDETRASLFTLFFSTKGAQGTGLGLFIAHQIASKHGGTIEVSSGPGNGSRFEVRLPLAGPR